jgi:hypothetical protein
MVMWSIGAHVVVTALIVLMPHPKNRSDAEEA